MRVFINGIETDMPVNTTATDLFTLTGIDSEQLVMEHNGVVVSPQHYGMTVLRDGDIIELIQFVGGG